MTKNQALRLKTGATIEYHDSRDWKAARTYWTGRVLRVTRNGGVKVLRDDGAVEWTGYHLVSAVL